MKRLAILVLAVAGLIGIAIAAAPLIAATDLAKRRIANQIEEWTGHPVTFVGEPEVKLFPFLSLTIEDARIGKDAGDGKPFVAMDRLTCKLRLLPFLLGRAEVAEFQLVRPEIRLTVDAEGNASWATDRSIAAAASKAMGRDPSSAGGMPDQIAEIKLGRFKVFDGTIVYDNARNGRYEELSRVSLDLRWPALAEPASGTGAFSWRNEVVEFNASLSRPLGLIAGDASPARFAVASSPLRVSFTGTANSLADLQLEGETTVTAPSVRRVLEWVGMGVDSGPILGAGLIEGRLNWIGSSFAFPTARLELDGNVAEGSMAIDFAGERPRLQGTLALSRLDLSAYLETLQARINAGGAWQMAPIDLPFLSLADVDVRLSAGEILIGRARMGKSAAAVTVNGGRLALNIGEAQLYGGRLSADAEVATGDDAVAASARITLTDTPAALALADLAGLSFVEGAAAARMALSGLGDTWGELAGSLTGSARVEISDGALVGFELGHLAMLAGGFNVDDPAPGSGTVPLKSLAATLRLADGKIASDDVVAEGETFSISLGGQLSLLDQEVRARGVLSAERAGEVGDERRDIPFVISGRWLAPLLLPDYERLIGRGNRTAPPLDSAAQRAGPNG